MKPFGRSFIRLSLSLLALCCLAQSSKATTVVMLSDNELIVHSRLIVTGKVRSVTSAWNDERTMIWTYVEVQTDRALKGYLPDSRIVIKQLGGDTGDAGVYVFGQPRFTQGQEVLLYLNTSPDGSLHVAHAFMGMFSIVEDERTGIKHVRRSEQAQEADVFIRNDSGVITDHAPLDEYINKINLTLEREADAIAQIEAARSSEQILAVPTEYKPFKKGAPYVTPSFVFIGSGVRWMQADSGQPVTFSINPNGSPVSGGGTAEITRGMDAWSAQSGANIRLQLSGQTGNCGLVSDGANVISFADCRSQLDIPVGCSGVVAQTSVAWTSESRSVGGRNFNRIIESDVVFNRGMDCFLGNSANLAEVACHELGHAIGLGHSADPAAIMWATAQGRGRNATLGADDKAGVLAIYPAAPGSGGGGGGGGTGGGSGDRNDATFMAQSVPSLMTAGQSYSVSITMRNTGTTTWSSSRNYVLSSQNPADNRTWGTNKVALTGSVGPAGQTTFTFNVTAPSAPGAYNFQWRMVQERVEQFGNFTPNITITVASADSGGGGGPVTITSLSIPNATMGTAYSQALSASGGRAPYRWALVAGSLPPGLTLTQTGLITGTPSATGLYSFTAQVFDVTSSFNNMDTKRLLLTVMEGNGGGSPSVGPHVVRVRLKGSKKLFVYGQNFTPDSLLRVNGVTLDPKSFEGDDVSGRLFYKGRLSLRERGTNMVVVLNSTGTSQPYFF